LAHHAAKPIGLMILVVFWLDIVPDVVAVVFGPFVVVYLLLVVVYGLLGVVDVVEVSIVVLDGILRR